MPPHPAQAFDFCVAEVLAPGDGLIGHMLVFAEPMAQENGHLWWKTYSDPEMTLEFWSYIHGEFDDPVLWDTESVEAGVAVLQRGEWPPFDDEEDSTTYLLRWLYAEESAKYRLTCSGSTSRRSGDDGSGSRRPICRIEGEPFSSTARTE